MKRLIPIFAIAVVLGTVVSAEAQALNAQLNLKTLWCGKTTEQGEDEIYLIVTGKRASDGATFKARLPADAPNQERGHWNMNDSGAKQNLNNIQIFALPLNPNDYVDVTVLIMEEDGGVPGTWMRLAGSLLEAVPEPTGVSTVVGSVLDVTGFMANTLGIKDTDDFIGSFHVRLQQQNGQLVAIWRVGEHAEDRGQIRGKDGILAHEFWFRGDGSYYRAYLSTNPSFVSAPLPAPPPPPHGTAQAPTLLELEPNFDRFGMDYKDFNVANAPQCQAECAKDPNCKAFSFGQTAPTSGHCWLKNNVPPKSPRNGFTSGVKVAAPPSLTPAERNRR